MKANPHIKRALWHDYRSPGRYLITLTKSKEISPFSEIDGDWQLPTGSPGASYTRWSPIGRIIADKLYQIRELHPALRTEQYIVMPDHVHILLWVQAPLPEHLGFYIARFKNSINITTSAAHIFDDGFNDQIITPKRNLHTIFNYIRSNPYRLAVRRACPDFFTRCNNLTIGDTPCQLYGNLHLLHNPFKDQVIVHRADDDQTFQTKRNMWIHTAANGGVLVSPFISQREKSIRKETQSLGGRFIYITNQPFGEREKPTGNEFELCAQGRLLIVAPAVPMPLDRSCCLKMNAIAALIASTTES